MNNKNCLLKCFTPFLLTFFILFYFGAKVGFILQYEQEWSCQMFVEFLFEVNEVVEKKDLSFHKIADNQKCHLRKKKKDNWNI